MIYAYILSFFCLQLFSEESILGRYYANFVVSYHYCLIRQYGISFGETKVPDLYFRCT
jgi:hypothetical protein